MERKKRLRGKSARDAMLEVRSIEDAISSFCSLDRLQQADPRIILSADDIIDEE